MSFNAAIEVAVGGFAGINGLVGEAADAEDFTVAPARIECHLGDDVGSLVEGEVGDVGAGVDRLVDRNRDIGRGSAAIGNSAWLV